MEKIMDITLHVSTGPSTLPEATSAGDPKVPNSETKPGLTSGGNANEPSNAKVAVSVNSNSKNDDWASTLVTSLKSVFESFITTMTKLLESYFGTAPKGTSNNSQSTSGSVSQPSQTSTRPLESFSDHTAKNLSANLKSIVSEERMQEAVVMYQLYQKDEAAEGIFKTKLEEFKANGKDSETAIKAALIETEKAGKIARWESDWVFSLSYRAAQFDSKLDLMGSEKEVSGKISTMQAIQQAERNLVSIATGVETPASRTI